MKLPIPVQTFFDAEGAAKAAPLGAFTPDAVVKDEGRTHAGHAAIGAWWRAAKAKYQHRAVPCEILQERGLTLVRARVTGRFPGSPAVLTFAFQLQDSQLQDGQLQDGQLQDGRIAVLEIGA